MTENKMLKLVLDLPYGANIEIPASELEEFFSKYSLVNSNGDKIDLKEIRLKLKEIIPIDLKDDSFTLEDKFADEDDYYCKND